MSEKVKSSSDIDDLETESTDQAPATLAGQHPLSIKGLVIVAGLNIACMVLMVYYFTANQGYSAMASNQSDLAAERLQDSFRLHPKPVVEDKADRVVESLPPVRNQGNVGFGAMTINIASFIPGQDLISVDRPDEPLSWLDEGSSFAETTIARFEEEGDQWVQLGALSHISTARRYWKKLLNDHEALLQRWTPRYVGPNEGGGSLYHLRIGPMAAKVAAKLCKDLKAGGAECFCMNAK